MAVVVDEGSWVAIDLGGYDVELAAAGVAALFVAASPPAYPPSSADAAN
jgi:hypothetical protein